MAITIAEPLRAELYRLARLVLDHSDTVFRTSAADTLAFEVRRVCAPHPALMAHVRLNLQIDTDVGVVNVYELCDLDEATPEHGG